MSVPPTGTTDVTTPTSRRPWADRAIAPWGFGVLVAVAVLLATAVIVRGVNDRHLARTQATVVAESSLVKTELELAIRERTVLADALAAFVRTDPDFSPEDFHRFAAQLQALQPDVRALQLAPDAVIRYVEPVEQNEAAVGLDLRSYGLQREVVRRTIESDRFVVGGPVPLVQGGSGLIARLAIMLDDDEDPTTPEVFWGLAQVVIDTEDVLGATQIRSIDRRLSVAIRGVDGLGADGEVFYGDPTTLEEPILLDVLLPGGSWQLAAAPAAGWPTWAPGSTPLTVGGVLLALLAGGFTWSAARRPADLRRRVAAATAELRSGRERIAAIMNRARDAILAVDTDLRVVDGNPAAEAVLGLTLDELRSRSLYDLLEDVPAPGGRLTTAGRRPDGEPLSAEVTLDWGEDGRTATVVIRDVTAQEQAKQELERYTRQLERLNEELTRVDALKRDFIGMASHEVRTPITAIRGFSVTLATRWDDLSDADRRRCFQVIHRQTERLWRLIDDLLVASSIESGTLGTDLVPTNVAALVSRVVDEAGLPRSQVVLSCPSSLEVEVPRDHLHRILDNFLNNAVKYGAPPIHVDVRLTPTGSLVAQVEDAGSGVAPEFLPHLFDPFTQASTGVTRTAVGAGLGLAVARGLAETAGGRVWYETAEGGGARFVVELPVGGPPPPPVTLD